MSMASIPALTAPGSPLVKTPAPPAAGSRTPGRQEAPRPGYVQLKGTVHRKLLNRLNLEALASVDRARAEGDIRTLLFELLGEESQPLSMAEREQILSDILDEVFGLGPLEPLLRDPTINDILVNTYKQVYVERGGVLERVPGHVPRRRHLMRDHRSDRGAVGRRVDDSLARWWTRASPDGSRVNAIIPPLAVDGPLLSIRRFPAPSA